MTNMATCTYRTTTVYMYMFCTGHFVHHCCDQLRSFKSQTDSGVPPQEAHRQCFPPLVTSKRAQSSPQCPSGESTSVPQW